MASLELLPDPIVTLFSVHSNFHEMTRNGPQIQPKPQLGPVRPAGRNNTIGRAPEITFDNLMMLERER